jgi:hypothetical protein
MAKPLPISEFFAQTLNAPLRNRIWSWGSVRETDGALFLRCWSDRIIQLEGGRAIEVLRLGQNLLRRKPGRLERERHVELLQSGHIAYAVVVMAVDVRASPRQILTYDDKSLFRLGATVEKDGALYAKVVSEVPVTELVR